MQGALLYYALSLLHFSSLQEEEEWEALLHKVEALELNLPEDGKQAEGEPGTSVAMEEIASLRQADQSLQKQLTMQVDGVCLVVGNIEDLVDRANETMREVTKQHHDQKFKSLPHFNSPARLIRAIVRQPPPTQP